MSDKHLMRYYLGYPLDRWSVPLCEEVSRIAISTNGNVEEEEKNCFMSATNRENFVQLNRNFIVDPEIVIQYIKRFVLFWEEENIRRCEDLTNRLDDKFVLYNVWCADEDTNQGKNVQETLSVRHYYHVMSEDGVYHNPKRKKDGV